jgi:hypothetical protein
MEGTCKYSDCKIVMKFETLNVRSILDVAH